MDTKTTLGELKQGQHFTDEDGRSCVFLGLSPDATGAEWGAYYYLYKGTWVVTDDPIDMEVDMGWVDKT